MLGFFQGTCPIVAPSPTRSGVSPGAPEPPAQAPVPTPVTDSVAVGRCPFLAAMGAATPSQPPPSAAEATHPAEATPAAEAIPAAGSVPTSPSVPVPPPRAPEVPPSVEALEQRLALYGQIATTQPGPIDVSARAQTASSMALRTASVAWGAGGAALAKAPPLHAAPLPPRVGLLAFINGVRRHRRNPIGFFDALHGQHGQTFRVTLPTGSDLLFDCRPQALSAPLVHTDNADETWEKPPLQGHGLSFLVGTENVFLANGEIWKQAHRAMQPHLSAAAIQDDVMTARVSSILDAHLDALAQRAAKGPVEVDVRPVMQQATLDVALQTLLGTTLSKPELERVQHAFGVVMEWLGSETLNPTSVSLGNLAGILPGAGALKEAYKTLTDLGDRIIAQRRAQPGTTTDLLDGLLQARDPETGGPFSDERLRNEVLTVLLAGHETTATLLSWSSVLLSRTPRVQAQLHAEADAAAGKPATSATLQDMTAVQNTIKETLRLYTPAWFLVRRAKADTTIGPPDQAIPVAKGTTVVMSVFHAHRDEEMYGVRKTGYPAAEFHPERYLNANPKTFPFGGGVRICLGVHLARLEAAAMLAGMARRFDLAAVSDAPVGVRSDISVHPSDTRVRLSLRASPPSPAAQA